MVIFDGEIINRPPIIQAALNTNILQLTSNEFNITPAGEAGGTVEVPVEVERAITYHKRGFYPVSGQFEYWQTSDPEGSNPSGNPLIDVTILVATDRS